MKILWSNNKTWNKPGAITDNSNGYGYATERCVDSLRRLGHDVTFDARGAEPEVHLWFDQPHHITWVPGAYRIAYHPWESTRLLPGWVNILNTADEVWAPSPLIADWYAKDGVTVPIYVFEHGVDKVWKPIERELDGPFRFLHIGAEAARKNGMETVRTFRKMFGGMDNVRLTMKMISPGWNIPEAGNVTYLNKKMDTSELIELFSSHHAFLYPSRGEGFGLTPLQAMATGMPTITLPAWAPYARFLDPHLNIGSTLTNTPDTYEHIHPGKMFQPHLNDMREAMRWAVYHYDEAQAFAHAQTKQIQAYYDWDRLTKVTFDALENRLKNR